MRGPLSTGWRALIMKIKQSTIWTAVSVAMIIFLAIATLGIRGSYFDALNVTVAAATIWLLGHQSSL